MAEVVPAGVAVMVEVVVVVVVDMLKEELEGDIEIKIMEEEMIVLDMTIRMISVHQRKTIIVKMVIEKVGTMTTMKKMALVLKEEKVERKVGEAVEIIKMQTMPVEIMNLILTRIIKRIEVDEVIEETEVVVAEDVVVVMSAEVVVSVAEVVASAAEVVVSAEVVVLAEVVIRKVTRMVKKSQKQKSIYRLMYLPMKNLCSRMALNKALTSTNMIKLKYV